MRFAAQIIYLLIYYLFMDFRMMNSQFFPFGEYVLSVSMANTETKTKTTQMKLKIQHRHRHR